MKTGLLFSFIATVFLFAAMACSECQQESDKGNEIARIEVDDDRMKTVLDHRKVILEKFRGLGFVYVSLDLQGYRSGSMNETLDEKNMN